MVYKSVIVVDLLSLTPSVNRQQPSIFKLHN